MALTMAVLAGILGMPASSDETALEAGVKDLVAMRPKLTALEQELSATAGKLELEASAHTATRTLLQEAKLKAEAIPEAEPVPAQSAGKFKVGEKALAGSSGEVEITEVMPSQPCYMAKAGEATACYAESMLAPVTPAVAAAATDAKAAFVAFAKDCNSKMPEQEIEALAWQRATGAITLTAAFDSIRARPAIPSGALEALKPEPVAETSGNFVPRNRF
jgi:hypothetical protein